MNTKFLIISLILFLFTVNVVLADVAMPLSLVTIPYFPIIILIEMIAFLILIKKFYKIDIGIKAIIVIVLIANIITSLLGTFFPIYRYFIGNLTSFVLSFIVSIPVEFAIFRHFLKFLKKKFNSLDLLEITFIINFFSYLFLFFLFFRTSELMAFINYSAIVNMFSTTDLSFIILILALFSFIISCFIVWLYERVKKRKEKGKLNTSTIRTICSCIHITTCS